MDQHENSILVEDKWHPANGGNSHASTIRADPSAGAENLASNVETDAVDTPIRPWKSSSLPKELLKPDSFFELVTPPLRHASVKGGVKNYDFLPHKFELFGQAESPHATVTDSALDSSDPSFHIHNANDDEMTSKDGQFTQGPDFVNTTSPAQKCAAGARVQREIPVSEFSALSMLELPTPVSTFHSQLSSDSLGATTTDGYSSKSNASNVSGSTSAFTPRRSSSTFPTGTSADALTEDNRAADNSSAVAEGFGSMTDDTARGPVATITAASAHRSGSKRKLDYGETTDGEDDAENVDGYTGHSSTFDSVERRVIARLSGSNSPRDVELISATLTAPDIDVVCFPQPPGCTASPPTLVQDSDPTSASATSQTSISPFEGLGTAAVFDSPAPLSPLRPATPSPNSSNWGQFVDAEANIFAPVVVFDGVLSLAMYDLHRVPAVEDFQHHTVLVAHEVSVHSTPTNYFRSIVCARLTSPSNFVLVPIPRRVVRRE